MIINFKPKDSDEIRTMHTKSNDIEIMIGNKTDEFIKELLTSLLQRYQERLEKKIRGSELVFDRVDFLHLHKISLDRGGSYIDFPEQLKNKKTTINPENNDEKCFQYALTVALTHQNIKNNPERISKIKCFINQYNQKEINVSLHKKDWKKFELNYESIAFNVLYIPHNAKEIRHTYKSKYISQKSINPFDRY